ncbi:YeiH family protein [Kiloniella sp. b19]|uniref:YeiH family protein n=1 Tax=Kiloniella sp. GXU_MW_B19 TaxID=3141326 RepID=UPI0031D9821C
MPEQAQDMSEANSVLEKVIQNARSIFPGFLISVLVALAAQFLSEHYGAPAMLMALLLGIALHFLGEDGPTVRGIEFSAKPVLRIGIALLGARISVELVSLLGLEVILLVVSGVVLTILFGLLGARLLNRGWRFAVLTGGAVAICGASAAIAIAAVLPKNSESERNLIFTVLSVTVLSTLAMIAYPPLTQFVVMGDIATGVFLGGTIHDVAQVVGAGFSISDSTGEIATVVKLIRVALLAPIVLMLSLFVRARFADSTEGKRPPLVPLFIIAFLVLATLNSCGLIPQIVADFLGAVSRWALLTAIAAVGMKTSLKSILSVGGQAIVLIVAETLFIATFIAGGILYLL